MQTGIVGLPQVGKTTLFRILTRTKVDEKSARGATHVGVARVPEPRIDQLAELSLKHGIPTTFSPVFDSHLTPHAAPRQLARVAEQFAEVYCDLLSKGCTTERD